MKKRIKDRFLLRLILFLLILMNLMLIYQFSEQTGTESAKTSTAVGSAIAGTVDKDFGTSDKEEDVIKVKQFLSGFRKFAHMVVFGTLAALIFLFLLTWEGHTLLRYAATLVLTLLYAMLDEWHQTFVDGRGASWTDVLTDMLGAAISATLILLVCFFVRKQPQRIQTTHYVIPAPRGIDLKIAVAADLHANPIELPLRRIREAGPDLILIPGDLMDDLDLRDPDASGYRFLKACAAIAPTYYSTGNHEIACYHKGNPWRHPIPRPIDAEVRERIAQTGAVFLDNESVALTDRILVCGLGSGLNGDKNEPDTAALRRFCEQEGVHILLSHHPEYYDSHIRNTNVDLTVCGHAHGGHWRVLGRGVYSPGQGLFPKQTAGVVENRCVISRGLGDHTRIPRFCNTPELVVIHFTDTANGQA